MGGGPDSALPLGAQEAPLVMNGELYIEMYMYINMITTYLYGKYSQSAYRMPLDIQ